MDQRAQHHLKPIQQNLNQNLSKLGVVAVAIPVIPALGRLKQEESKSEARKGYTMISKVEKKRKGGQRFKGQQFMAKSQQYPHLNQ
jgi:hypothetical protein